MKDLIAERDKKDKMNNSVIKWWNVHYMTPEELEEAQAKEQREAGAKNDPEDGMSDEQRRAAQDIIDRLNREAAEDELVKQREIEKVRAEAENTFNATTGSNSGAYGRGGADAEHKDQINAILSEKDDAIRNLFAQASSDD